jgi:hypothetical protein
MARRGERMKPLRAEDCKAFTGDRRREGMKKALCLAGGRRGKALWPSQGGHKGCLYDLGVSHSNCWGEPPIFGEWKKSCPRARDPRPPNRTLNALDLEPMLNFEQRDSQLGAQNQF